jgi:mRNA interferase HigB
MRIIKRSTLTRYFKRHAETRSDLEAWYAIAEKSDWKTPADVKYTFARASIIGDNRVVFNICGNSYRLTVKIEYKIGLIFIRHIGTHKEYDKIDAEEI